MQGCALQCQYCHNPDSWDMRAGRLVEVDEILAEIEPYLEYYRHNGGGITVSGGEPTLQAPFVAKLFKEIKKRWKLSTAIDSSGFCEPSFAEDLLSVTDLVLLDLKEMNPERHLSLAGQSNERILRFARHLSDRGTRMWIRHVLVPGVTDGQEDLLSLGRFIGSLQGVEKFEILPYHRMGVYKWQQLGREYELEGVETPSERDVERAYRLVEMGRAEAEKGVLEADKGK